MPAVKHRGLLPAVSLAGRNCYVSPGRRVSYGISLENTSPDTLTLTDKLRQCHGSASRRVGHNKEQSWLIPIEAIMTRETSRRH